MRKISNIETPQLYAFTRKHYVEYYDLQTELVDHLANGIEELWVEKPNLPFDDALQVEFKKFGVFGFTDLVTERKAKMSRRYNHLILDILKTYFTVPRIFFTIMLMLFMYLFLSNVMYKEYVVIGLFALSITIVACKTIMYKKQQKQYRKQNKKLWMFEETIYTHGQSFALVQLAVFLPQHFVRSEFILKLMNYPIGLVFLSVLLTTFLIGVYVVIKVIPSEAKRHISKIHPEYNLV